MRATLASGEDLNVGLLAGRPIQFQQRGGVIPTKTKEFQRLFGETQSQNQKMLSSSAETLVFCEKSTGAPRFKVDLAGDREMALSRAASLLAIGCMTRGESPSDYVAWVPAETSTIARIQELAGEFLHTGRSFSLSVDLSPREAEVLQELLRNRVNKEIADHLCISVRTVKFHVSALLAKFGVGNRWDLIQKAQPMLTLRQSGEDSQAPQPQTPPAEASTPQPSAAFFPKESGRQRTGPRVVPFPGPLRPA